MIDRLRLGYVVDFVDIGIGGLRWYTFNVADAAISIAIVLLLAGRPSSRGLPGSDERTERRGPADGRRRVERVEGDRAVDPLGGGRRPDAARARRVRRGRVDRYVADATGLSRSYVQKLIADGRLTADGVPLKANTIVRPGRRASARRPGAGRRWTSRPSRESRSTIVYEDDDLLIIDKPAGLVVHPSPGHTGGTLVNALLRATAAASCGGIAGVQRPGIVHRLDRDTSGLLMVARHDAAQASLDGPAQGAPHQEDVPGPRPAARSSAAVGRIEAPIGRDPKHRTRMAVVPDGRPSVDRLPRPRAVRRLDAPRARPRDRADPPDPGPSRGDRPPGRRRPGLRRPAPRGAGRTASSACSCTPGGSS